MSRSATAARTPLSLVEAAPLSAAERLRQAQAAIKADADASLTDLLAKIEACAAEARDLSSLDSYPEPIRALLNTFAVNTTGSLDALSRQAR